MKRIFCRIFVLIFLIFTTSLTTFSSESEKTYTLQAGVSLIEQVPDAFFGNWRVTSRLKSTNAPHKFSSGTVDLWNLSREGDVLNLSNPFTGVSASVKVTQVKPNSIQFVKVTESGNQHLVDVVDLKLNGNYFSGTNTLNLQIFSDISSNTVSTLRATYSLRGEKISGMSIY